MTRPGRRGTGTAFSSASRSDSAGAGCWGAGVLRCWVGVAAAFDASNAGCRSDLQPHLTAAAVEPYHRRRSPVLSLRHEGMYQDDLRAVLRSHAVVLAPEHAVLQHLGHVSDHVRP